MDDTLIRLALALRRPALLPPGVDVPAIALAAPPEVEPQRLRALRELCGIAFDDRMPPTWPQVRATPLLLRLMASDAFPLRPLGLVHVAQRIDVLRPVRDDVPLALECATGCHREIESGQSIEIAVHASVDGERVWSGVSTVLARRPRAGPRERRAPARDWRDEIAYPHARPIPAPADTGRRYARISGDWNPIHLWPATARVFGFEAAIAHGLWTLARALAVIQVARPALGDAPRRIDVRFGAPLLLPAEPVLRWRDDGDAVAFAVVPRQQGRPHASGTIALSGAR